MHASKQPSTHTELPNTVPDRLEPDREKTEPATIKRGGTQGDCISPILINMIGNKIMPCRFADDTTTLCEYNPEGIRKLIDILRRWGNTTGIKLSNNKCKFMAVNLTEGEIENIKNITRFTHVSSIKHLGLTIQDNGRAHDKDNL